MTRMVSARELIGKKIVGFTPNSAKDRLGRIYHEPTIALDDGSVLYFLAEETEDEYGVFIGRVRG